MVTPPKPATCSIAAVLVCGLWCLAAAAAGDEPFWPQFHGANRDNLSTETGLLKQWPEEGPKLLWTTKGLGHGFAGVSIADGLMVTAGNIDDDTVITALDTEGRIRWQVTNGKAWHRPTGGTRGTPTIDGGRLYHESPHGDVVCLDAKTGQKHWGLNLLKTFHSKNITWALSESLLIDGDRVICSPGGPETAVVALDKQTGHVVWKSPSAGDLAGYASPILFRYRGLRLIVTLTSRACIGVNADTGELLWRFEHRTPFDETIPTPIYHDGHVFITTRSTGSVLLKIIVDGDRVSVDNVWRSGELDNQHGGVILVDGYLYGASLVKNRGRWICLEWKSGDMMYAEPGVGKGSLTYADGMLYTMNEHRTVGLVEATPRGHRVVSRFNIPAGGEGPTWAHPVVCGGRLYIRHGEFLYCYDVRAE